MLPTDVAWPLPRILSGAGAPASPGRTKATLRFLSGLYLHPHKWHRLRLMPPPDETLHRIVTADKLTFAHKVLVKTLG